MIRKDGLGVRFVIRGSGVGGGMFGLLVLIFKICLELGYLSFLGEESKEK